MRTAPACPLWRIAPAAGPATAGPGREPINGPAAHCDSGRVVRAGGIEPPRAKPDGFSYQLRLSPPPGLASPAWRLWSGLSLHRAQKGFRCCPSSLYTFPTQKHRAWLGIAMSKVSPNLSSSASPVSRASTQWPKSVASTGSATPARPPSAIERLRIHAKADMRLVPSFGNMPSFGKQVRCARRIPRTAGSAIALAKTLPAPP